MSINGRSWKVWGRRDLDLFAEFCEVLAQLARSANAVHVQQFIGDASNSYLPGRSSTVPPAPQGEVVDGATLELTPVERRVVRPDRTEQEMLRLISAQRSVMRSFRVIVMGWRACATGVLPDVCPEIVDVAGPARTWGRGELSAFAKFCDVSAKLARAANAEQIQRFLRDAVTGRPVVGVVRPDRGEQGMLQLFAAQRDVMRDFHIIHAGWKACDPDRRPESCLRCGNPFPRGSTRCDNLVDDGNGGRKRCEASADDRTCANPRCDNSPVPHGQRMIRGADKQMRCRDCNAAWKTSGVERIPVSALALGEGLLEDGVFNCDDLERIAAAKPLRRGRNMTPAERSAQARKAAAARWNSGSATGVLEA